MLENPHTFLMKTGSKRELGTSIRFIAQVSKEAAAAKKKELIAAMRSPEHMPQRFPFFNETYIPANKYHKMYVENWYLVFYQIQDDTVYVDHILDFRRDHSLLIK